MLDEREKSKTKISNEQKQIVNPDNLEPHSRQKQNNKKKLQRNDWMINEGQIENRELIFDTRCHIPMSELWPD